MRIFFKGWVLVLSNIRFLLLIVWLKLYILLLLNFKKGKLEIIFLGNVLILLIIVWYVFFDKLLIYWVLILGFLKVERIWGIF